MGQAGFEPALFTARVTALQAASFNLLDTGPSIHCVTSSFPHQDARNRTGSPGLTTQCAAVTPRSWPTPRSVTSSLIQSVTSHSNDPGRIRTCIERFLRPPPLPVGLRSPRVLQPTTPMGFEPTTSGET